MGSKPNHQPSKITRAAYHEAGHAVVAEVLGRQVRFVRVNESGGLMRTSALPRFDLRRGVRTLRERWHREREAMIYFAGLIAEEMLTGRRTLDGVGRDFDAIEALLCTRNARQEEALAYGRWLYERTASILMRHWDAVERVATALAASGRISGSQVRRMCGNLKRESA